MSKTSILMWFRQDLRLADNPALTAAAKAGQVLPVYILDDINSEPWQMGAASRWWLHHSLTALDEGLDGHLLVLKGDPSELIPELVSAHDIEQVYWNRCYEPWRSERDTNLKQALQDADIKVTSCNGSLLVEPWTNLKDDDSPYKVFTPFYRRAMSRGIDLDQVLGPAPSLKLMASKSDNPGIDSLNLLPDIDWASGFNEFFQPGEQGALQQLKQFLENGIHNYKEGRDYPALESVSRLSPHIHFGEIAPHRIFKESTEAGKLKNLEPQSEHFARELIWREFSYTLLHYFPELPDQNMNRNFDYFPWRRNSRYLQAWQRGLTGYPLVDAGMRELWQTGYMHNRVRMIVGSFLVKNLLQDWREGARWFWDCLLDADLANNTASWQWVAGCGADAAPYFRVFNPVTQSSKFDAAPYIKRYVPELAELDDRYVHEPAAAPSEVLKEAGVELGVNYPKPIVELKASREKALAAYQELKSKVA